MQSPFPGMDPYLEHPELWSEVHNRLIVAIADAIAPPLRPKYRVAIDKRTYLSDGDDSISVAIPDGSVLSRSGMKAQPATVATLPAQSEAVAVIIPTPEEVSESYLEIREVATGSVVSAIEILSPKNKRGGEGQNKYLTKRRKVLNSLTHLIEIDLLRSGKPMPILGDYPKTDYRILVSRENRRPRADLFPFSVRQEIPKFSIPLQSGDTEPLVDLQSLLGQVYDRARFEMAIDYHQEPVPPLTEEDRVWSDALLREQGIREQRSEGQS